MKVMSQRDYCQSSRIVGKVDFEEVGEEGEV